MKAYSYFCGHKLAPFGIFLFFNILEVSYKNVETTLQKLVGEFKSTFNGDLLNVYKLIFVLYFPNCLFALNKHDVVKHVLPPYACILFSGC
jgi:hypothetical protein